MQSVSENSLIATFQLSSAPSLNFGLAQNGVNIAKITFSVFDLVENIVGKGEDTGYQHFLLFPQCFQKASFLGSLELGIM